MHRIWPSAKFHCSSGRCPDKCSLSLLDPFWSLDGPCNPPDWGASWKWWIHFAVLICSPSPCPCCALGFGGLFLSVHSAALRANSVDPGFSGWWISLSPLQSFGVSGSASVQIPYANNHVQWLLESSCFLARQQKYLYPYVFTERCGRKRLLRWP